MRKVFIGQETKKIFEATYQLDGSSYYAENTTAAGLDVIIKKNLLEDCNYLLSELNSICLEEEHTCVILAGPGYKGAVALRLALELLKQLEWKKFNLYLYFFNPKKADGSSFFFIPPAVDSLLVSLREQKKEHFVFKEVETKFDYESFPQDNLYCIDGLIGMEVTAPLKDKSSFRKVINFINTIPKKKLISIDFPSGLVHDFNPELSEATVLEADCTYQLHFPKLSSFFEANQRFYGNKKEAYMLIEALPTSLSESFIYEILDYDVKPQLEKYSPQNIGKQGFKTYFLAEGENALGRSYLAIQSAVYSAIYSFSLHLPYRFRSLLQSQLPMLTFPPKGDEAEENGTYGRELLDLQKPDYKIYPILSVEDTSESLDFLHYALSSFKDKSLIFGKDALSILARKSNLKNCIPYTNSILIGDKESLASLLGLGGEALEEDVFQAARIFSEENKTYIVFMSYAIFIFTPEGKVLLEQGQQIGRWIEGQDLILIGLLSAFLSWGMHPTYSLMCAVHIFKNACSLYMGSKASLSLNSKGIVEQLPEAFKELMHQF